MDNRSCFSPENTKCQIGGFDFNDDFDCKVCLKANYAKIIQAITKRGRSGKLTAIRIAEKLSGTQSTVDDVSEVCKYRGKLLQKAKCKCNDGAVWECLHSNMLTEDGSVGKQIGKACGLGRCKEYKPI